MATQSEATPMAKPLQPGDLPDHAASDFEPVWPAKWPELEPRDGVTPIWWGDTVYTGAEGDLFVDQRRWW